MIVALEDRVALVTGASRGIGRAVALALASEGADIVCVARSSDDAPSRLPGTVEETARQVEAQGRRALAVACDIRSEDDVRGLVQRALEAFGRIDILINNAAVNYRAPFIETPRERWDLVLDVNLGGTVNCIRAVLPHMVEQRRGSIINVSSGAVTDAGVTAALGITAYAASKAAVESLTRSLAAEVQAQAIAVNCLRIETAVATEGARRVDPEGDYSDWAQPEAVAEALVWLATRPPVYTRRVVTLSEIAEERAGR